MTAATPPEPSQSAEDAASVGAIGVAAPFALVVTFFLARILPIHFAAPPNPLGIVSWATRSGYPPFQEIFWYAFALSTGTLVAWRLARIAGRRQSTAIGQLCLEVLGALAILAVVFRPTSTAFLTLLFAGAIAWRLLGPKVPARGTGSGGGEVPVRRWRLQGLPFAGSALVVALLLSPFFWQNALDVLRDTPDDVFASDGWYFQAELGQHLAWADDLLRGQVPGRDFFMLYGPLYSIGAVGAWQLLGRSVAVWLLYYASLNILGLLSAMALAARLIERRVLCLALPFLLVPIVLAPFAGLDLRYGLALAGLACLVRAFERDSVRWVAAAGAVGGAGMLFSQEFAFAFLLCAGVALLVRARWREALGFVAGLVVGAAPCLLWLAWVGALMPMLRDLAGYPEWVMAGFGKLPFPSAQSFPIPIPALHSANALQIRLGYATPAVCWVALLWAVGIDRLDPRHPIASLRALRSALLSDPRRLGVGLLALFGLFAFRFALGRSALSNTIKVCGAASILLCVGLDGALDRWRSARVLAAWRAAALAGVALLGGFVGTATDYSWVAVTTTPKIALGTAERFVDPTGKQDVIDVLHWIERYADPADQVLFLPNHAGYYYLLNRRSPIRFMLGHQLVTNAHRAEAMAQLRAAPPRFIVYAGRSLMVDGIPHADYLGPAIAAWIREDYLLKARIGSVDILEHQPPPSATPQGSPPG